RAKQAAREADRAEAEAWSIRRRPRAAVADDRTMRQRRARLARGGVQPVQDPRKPSSRCDPRPRDTPIWKLEAALKCRSCKKGRYAPPGAPPNRELLNRNFLIAP